jgi:hypothetical protein|nr:MAG TPA: tail tubular protein [Caudoviricetes sp.]
MASVVTICNLALSRIGDRASISSIDPPDGSLQANACSRLYPIALASCLDMHNWSFATRRAKLAKLSYSGDKGDWLFAYALPSDCRRVIDIKGELPCHLFSRKEEFETVGEDFGMVLLTNAENPSLRYITSEPKVAQFSGLFVDALAWLLASYLAGETIRGDSAFSYGTKCLQQFSQTVASAAQQDARLVHKQTRHVATWISRR